MALARLNAHVTSSSSNGHYFKKRVLNKPLDCGQCREALFVASSDNAVKTVMECEECHAVCHTYCKLNFDISCQDYTKLKTVTPSYFMAVDVSDKLRWLSGIDQYVPTHLTF